MIRCEDCGHPMSEGTWTHEPPCGFVEAERRAMVEHDFSTDDKAVHYSPCDEGCRHGGPGREQVGPEVKIDLGAGSHPIEPVVRREASWRQVDVRTLGWPHDLRPEKLAVLCLRCYAERNK